MPASPSTDNYYIGKGVITFQATGESAARDLGNCEQMEFSPSIEKLDHYSSRTGVKSKDKSIIVEKGGSLRIVMDEVTGKNLALAVAGTVTQNSAGQDVVDILATNAVEGVVVYTGANEVGNKLTATFNKVSFAPEGSVSFISDEWGQLEISGEVLADGAGDFGTIVEVPQA